MRADEAQTVIRLLRYLVLIEETSTGFSAFSPDLSGCVAAAMTKSEVERLMQEAISMHLESMREDGRPIPRNTTSAAYVEVAA